MPSESKFLASLCPVSKNTNKEKTKKKKQDGGQKNVKQKQEGSSKKCEAVTERGLRGDISGSYSKHNNERNRT